MKKIYQWHHTPASGSHHANESRAIQLSPFAQYFVVECSYTPNPFPRTFSKNLSSWDGAVCLYFCGRGSNSSSGSSSIFFCFPKVCFSTWMSLILVLLCFRWRGGFHWQGYDVTGRSSSSISTLSMNWDGVMATSACKSADTCVHVADFLYYKNNDPCTKLCVK